MFTTILLAAALQGLAPQTAAHWEAMAGHWQGNMQRGSAQLHVSFDFPADAPGHGFFSASDLGAIDIPLSNVKQGHPVHWELVGDTSATVFDGLIDGNSMTGTFVEKDRNGTFTLHRSSTSTEEPYSKDEVTFQNGSVRLSGTVFAPRTAGKHPAVIFVHGSGAEGRWAAAYLADFVAKHGMVALIYDKRGVGASTGDWHKSKLQDLANDARAGIGLLVLRADVDGNKVGVYGHSQGGQLAPAIAEHNSDVKWIIAADGPVGPQYRQDIFRVNTTLARHLSGKELRDAETLYAEFVDVARMGTPHDKLRADVKSAGTAAWLDYLGIPDDNDWIWDWYKMAGNYDNSTAWATVRVPVLLLFGADDALVPPRETITRTTAILKAHGNMSIAVRMFPGADHTLRIPPATPDDWPHNAEGFPNIIPTFARGELRP